MPTLDEFELIDRFFRRPPTDPAVEVGIGDDAAVLRVDAPLVVAVDTLVGGVHFPPDLVPDAVGHRALAVNLSDFAAMGAVPRWATLALTLPDADAGWVESFCEGFFALADRFGVSLVGGDTTRGPLAVTVELMGATLPAGALLRSGGAVGDDVYVTGTLGDAAAGLAALAGGASSGAAARLIERFARPEPRLDLGLALTAVASAAIDVSDGLVADLGHVCRASGCGARIDLEGLPLSSELLDQCTLDRAREYALGGGDDYELCFTAAAGMGEQVLDLARDCETPVARIGSLTSGSGVVCALDGRPVPIAVSGFRHF